MTRDTYEVNTNQQQQDNSVFYTDHRVQFRIALRNNDFHTFKRLVDFGSIDLEHVYQFPDYKTILELAITESKRVEFVKLLLHYEVQVNKINETHLAAPIHFAVDCGNIEALKLLLDCDQIDVNVKSKGNTALLLAIKKIGNLKDDYDEERDICTYESMVVMLLKAGCNPNSPDYKGVTAVAFAAKQKLEKVITYILDYATERVDLDAYRDYTYKTARYYLSEAFPHLVTKFFCCGRVNNVDKLFYYLIKHEEDNFVREFLMLDREIERPTALAANNGMYTMLQLATKDNLKKVVKTLLDSGADPNDSFSGNTNRPIAYACQNGYCRILKMFIDEGSTRYHPINSDSLLKITVQGMRTYSKNPNSDFKGCLELLLTHHKVKGKINVNHQDMKDNTALHYAARNRDNETVLELLKNGACIGLRNKFNVPPLADINAKTFETYLDECITSNGERPGDDDYEIHINYSFLVYPSYLLKNEECKDTLMNTTNNNIKEAIIAPEIDALLYMTGIEEMRPLLKHPVFTSFLYLKWERISCLFYANITFFSLLWLCLVLYIICGYGVETKQTDAIEVLNVVTHVGAIIGLILLIVRELFQVLVSPTKYLLSVENWMEVALIIVTAWIVCYDSASESTKQQLSAVAILLSSAELVLLIGQHPMLSTNITMLKTVSWNFLKFLLWYCILIIAFALSFYTLFRKVTKEEDQVFPNQKTDEKNTEEEEEEDFFQDPVQSLFKTIIMMTGEFDASSIKFSTFPVTSHMIFIVFVFMIPIVLFNLLNALAVSDTQEIRADAELVGHISRIKLISYFERVLIGNRREISQPIGSCSWLPQQQMRLLCVEPLARRVSLFSEFLPVYRIIVKPNARNKIKIPYAESSSKFGEEIENGGCCLERCQYRLEREIVENAMFVISKKTNQSEFDEIKSKIDILESTLKEILLVLHSSKK